MVGARRRGLGWGEIGCALVLVLFVSTSGSAEAQTRTASDADLQEPLGLDEAVEMALQSFPLIRAFVLEDAARSEAARVAAGAFDTRLSLGGDVRPLGFYENWTGFGSVEQLSPYWGLRFYSAYRYGEGDFPSYDGKRLTDGAGELSLGVEVPLLRGRDFDRERAASQRTQLDQSSYSPELALERIALIRAVSFAYLDWMAAGHVVGVVEDLLAVANARQSQLERLVAEGDEAEINLRDNQRLVIERRSLLRGAERDFRQAALKLAIFLRSESGARLVLDEARLPRSFPAEALIDADQVERDVMRARMEHPRLQRLALEREQLSVDVRLAKNEVLPGLNLGVEGSQDFGESRAGIDERGKLSSDSRGSTELGLNLRLEFPVQQRKARGRLGLARIRLQQLERRTAFAEMEIETEARVALEALEAAFDQTRYARENVELADQLRTAEVRKLDAGLSNLINLNIREIQVATAAKDLVQAQRDYFRALAEYRARIAISD